MKCNSNLLFYSVANCCHKIWEFMSPEQNQGDWQYETVVAKLDKLTGTLHRQSVENKAVYYNYSHLKYTEQDPEGGIVINRMKQKPGNLILSFGAIHQGMGMVSIVL